MSERCPICLNMAAAVVKKDGFTRYQHSQNDLDECVIHDDDKTVTVTMNKGTLTGMVQRADEYVLHKNNCDQFSTDDELADEVNFLCDWIEHARADAD